MKKFPFPFVLSIGYRLSGDKVDVLWKVENPADEDLYFSIGAHPAFLCPVHGEKDKTGYRLLFDGVTEIHDIYHIDRGYDNLDGKLAHLGAKMWREEVED